MNIDIRHPDETPFAQKEADPFEGQGGMTELEMKEFTQAVTNGPETATCGYCGTPAYQPFIDGGGPETELLVMVRDEADTMWLCPTCAAEEGEAE